MGRIRKLILLVALLCAWKGSQGQAKTDSLLVRILRQGGDSLMAQVLGHPESYRTQIIYTRIDRDRHNRPRFHNYYFNVDSLLYFNPASTVKLPLSCLALEKLNRMHRRGVDKFTPLQLDSAFAGQTTEYRDSTARDGFPSIAQFIRKAFLVSDNDAYNRLYEFVGPREINRNLHSKGYQDVRICRQFMPFSQEQNRHTNPVRFIRPDGSLIWKQPAAYNQDSFDFSHRVFLGIAYYDSRDSLVHAPMDFTRQNNISLEDLQQILQSVLFPESVPLFRRFDLSKGDYRFLYRYLSQFPSETNYPDYDSSNYYDTYVKFFFRNGGHHLPAGVRVFNKVGWSYGFLTDVSYVADFTRKVEFMLSADLYVNSDGVLNDDRYDYDSIGYPFLYALGQAIYRYELGRPRGFAPDLSRLRVPYGHRHTGRKPVKVVDN